MLDKKTVRCFGNSHVRYTLGFSINPDEIVKCEYDNIEFSGMQTGNTGATAWSLSKNNSKTEAGKKVIDNLSDFKNLFFAYGEVDIREHIQKHTTESLLQTIKQVIDKYTSFLKSLQILDKNLMLMSAIPYTRKFHSAKNGKSYFKLAPVYWNALLMDTCDKNGWHYIDAFETFCDNELYLKDEYSANPNDEFETHFAKTTQQPIIDKIKKVIL